MPVPRISPDDKSCMNCSRFDFHPQKPRLNRECLFKGKITTKYGRCAQWRDCRTLTQRLRREKVMKAFTK